MCLHRITQPFVYKLIPNDMIVSDMFVDLHLGTNNITHLEHRISIDRYRDRTEYLLNDPNQHLFLSLALCEYLQ